MATHIAELQAFSVKELKNRARELGAPAQAIDDLDDAADVKTAAIQLVIRHDKDLLDDPRAKLKEAELQAFSVKEQKNRARELGAPAQEIDAAADVKTVAVQLEDLPMSSELKPVAAMPAGARPPPQGLPAGGVYTEKPYCGPLTWGISILCAGNGVCLCAPFCPCDRRVAYVTPDTRQYSPKTGKEYKQTCGVYCCCE